MWKLYRIALKLRSPLHVGYLKMGNLMRTRPYVPGKTIWGAVTAALALHKFDGNFKGAQDAVKSALAFSYFYPALEPDKPLWPCYTEKGFCYGEKQMLATEFERRLISVYGSTALDYSCNAAAAGSLHEVEFLSPYDLYEGRPVYLVGYVFERQESSLQWCEVLGHIRLGGERKYGWGCVAVERGPSSESQIFSLQVELSGERPRVRVKAGSPVLAHTVAAAVQARGQIEPLVARETHEAGRFGGSFSQDVPICWAPGAVLQADYTFEIDPYGVWEPQPDTSTTRQ